MTRVTAEQLAEWKKQAERLRYVAGYHRMDNGHHSFIGTTLCEAADSIDALAAIARAALEDGT